MKRRLTAMFLSICLVFLLIPVSAQASLKPNIQIGDYVKMGTYNGNSILWRCVSIDADGPLMLADKIVDTLAYDAKTNDNSNSKSHSRSYKRDDYGSNYWRDSDMRSWLNSTATARKAILMSALLQVSKRMTTQFQNLPRMQIRIGMSAPSKAFSSPSARGIQMTENTLTLPSLFILFKRHEATLKIWLLSFAARDTQKVSRANSSMMSNDFGRTL